MWSHCSLDGGEGEGVSAGVGGVSEGSLVGEPKHDSIREQDNWRNRRQHHKYPW